MRGLLKNELRTEIKKIRSKLGNDEVTEAGKKIYGYISSDILKPYEKTLVLLFASYQNEPDTYIIYENLIKDYPECVIAYPAVSDDNINMEFYRVDDISQLICGYKGIKEPDKTKCDIILTAEMALYNKIVVIMPGLAFDSMGNRTGYGGGFYDRYMLRLEKSAEHSGEEIKDRRTGILKIGICHDFQYLDNNYIITDENDIRCDCIITDKRIIWR